MNLDPVEKYCIGCCIAIALLFIIAISINVTNLQNEQTGNDLHFENCEYR